MTTRSFCPRALVVPPRLASLWAGVLAGALIPLACAIAQDGSAPGARASSGASMFRGGAARPGVYADVGVPAFGGLQWRVQTGGPIRSSPVVAGNVVYVGSSDGHLYAIDARRGTVTWRAALGSAVVSSAAVANGLVYINGNDGTFRALRAADGRGAWSFKTGAAVPLRWGLESGMLYTSSPAVANGMVVFGSVDGHVYALDAAGGGQRWRYAAGSRVYSSPAVAGGAVYVGAQDGTVHAIDATTGRRKWRFETEGAKLTSASFGFDRTTVQSSPAVVGGAVYVGARDGFLYAIDAATGTQRWRFDHKVSWVNASPAVSNGLVYAASSDGHFIQAVDAATGEERWRAPTVGIAWSSPAVDAQRVYAGEDNGTLYALDKVTGKEVWRYRIGNRIYSSPVVAGGRVYVGSDDGAVYAVNAAPGGVGMRRAVFWDSTYLGVPLATGNERVRSYLAARNYEVLDAAGLQQFLSDRLRDRAPSVVVFAIDHLPSSVAPVAADTVLFRRYLNAGGTVVWLGAPPRIAPVGIKSMTELDRSAAEKLIGVRYRRGNFDALGVTKVTGAGKRLGLPDWYMDNWGADVESVDEVLAHDEQGQAAAWVKRFGGPPGTGFIRLFGGDGLPGRPMTLGAIQTAAELRPR